ncbi:MAG: acetaldehyde dehydrogenase (acetylating) [Fibromonadales bacterium]|nr:acetaldehyde dehydrogenase (acetylating) [Fibromonadales bacterium]
MKAKVGIIGTGNIGCDLLVKVMRSDMLECSIFAGHNPDSEGIKFAKKLGIPTTFDSIKYIENHPDCCDIVFDATSAKVHIYNAPILERLSKFAIDLTPARVGYFCVPIINLKQALEQKNVNLITCGGQATIPVACALAKIHPEIEYLEIAATIASRSAGIGTRNNIDEFTQATKDALKDFTGIKKTKAIIVLNPAEPPINMRTTIYALVEKPNMDAIRKSVFEMAEKVKNYIPGYKTIVEPTLENGRITTTIEVTGRGDYLPSYAGNLDVITCAAVKIAEAYAQKHGGV